MAKNDKILIDGIIDERIELKLPSDKRDEAFEYFAFEQILKDYDPSVDELMQGSVDGRNDGGIDGFYSIINGHILSDPETFIWPKSGAVLEVWIITCKLHDTFKQAPLDNLAASLIALFDFSLENTSLRESYSERILRLRENLKLAYRKISPRLSQFSINFCYASRGNTSELGESIASRAKQIIQIAKDAFGNCSSSFIFYGSSELIDLHRKAPNFSLELPFIEDLSSGETYILLVNLKDYFNFIQDGGKLRRYLFDSNVRDFMGMNRVNEDIRNTLSDTNSPDFWWLNNGVTILATGAAVIGKIIKIQDIQIVNGLQTSESIFRHFENGGDDLNNRSVLVKVIVSNNSKVRDTIIRATNNQTSVELSSLHATDKIQRDIEDVLKQHDLFYERRTNFYKNQGVPSEKIITPLYLASGFVNLILKAADEASKLKSRFMRSELSYNKVFSPSVDLNIWPKIASLLKKTDIFLEGVRPTGSSGSEHFLKSRRQILSFLSVSRILGTFNFTINDLVVLDLSKYTEDELHLSWEYIKSFFPSNSYSKIKSSFFKKICIDASVHWNIEDVSRVTRFNNFDVKSEIEGFEDKKESSIVQELALKVNKLLPPQPWKPGIDKEVIGILKCTRSDYFDAVKFLINEGLRFTQKDGVVFDDDGNVIGFDSDRVDAETLKLKNEEE